ncbi:MAG: hypothetical protein JKY55_08375 [Aliivibrio sp.]|uniref:hypothetical protein n=1 Tax=Aliivibrio sp. TaxID=1872443 RepID=UPI001A5DCE55|nr:hypothetical protein [Aliivibrio sp.]
MNPVEQLSKAQLETEIFHPDGDGHVQVETVSYSWGESPSELLEQINQQDLWEEFYHLLENRPEKWRFDLLDHFPLDKVYNVTFRMKLLDIVSSDTAIHAIISDAPMWLWNAQTLPYLTKVIEIAKQQLTTLDPDDVFIEFESEQLSNLIDHLRTIEQLKAITGNQ